MRLADLSGLPLTYSPVGLTQGDELPPGFNHLRVERRVGTGERAFQRARASVLAFGAQRGAGLRPRASAPVAAPGVELLCFVGFGSLSLAIPCRVVWALDEPDRTGFGYGTLEGHLESGEEGFLVERRGEDVYAVVIAYSVPVSRVARLGGPVTLVGQRLAALLYLHALRRAARG